VCSFCLVSANIARLGRIAAFSSAVVLLTATPRPVAADDFLQGIPPDEARQLLQWGVDWVRQLIPETYHNDKKWGQTKQIVSGLDIHTKGGRLHTRRRRKAVEHGRWLRYDVHLGDPSDPDRLDIRVLRAEQGEDRRLRFDIQVDTVVDIHLQQQRWNLGTKLFSLSVDARAKLRLMLSGDIAFELDLTRIPPDVLADPRILSTDLQLVDLDVDRIGKIGGDVAESVGDLVKRVIREEYLPEQQAKITNKLNGQIERRRDRLRLSAGEWLTRKLTQPPASPVGTEAAETTMPETTETPRPAG